MADKKGRCPVNKKITITYHENYSNGSFHGGLDLNSKVGIYKGDKVYCPLDGVVYKKKLLNDSYGHFWCIKVNLNNINYYIYLCHMDKMVTNYSVGDNITKGTYLGTVGSTGNSTGPHLHIEVRRGSDSQSYCVDPHTIINFQDIKGNSNEDAETTDTTTSKEDTIYNKVTLQKYSGKGKIIKAGSTFPKIYFDVNLKDSFLTVRQNEEFEYLGKVKDKNIYFCKFFKGGSYKPKMFVQGKYCGGKKTKSKGKLILEGRAGELIGNTNGNSLVTTTKKQWLDVIKKVHEADYAKGFAYSQSVLKKIKINNKTYPHRPDCSGYISCCVNVFKDNPNYMNEATYSLIKTSSKLSKAGFTRQKFDVSKLQPGDICVRKNHTAIFVKKSANGVPCWYDHGSTKGLQTKGVREFFQDFDYIWRL